ncbi:MAG: universal stress protein [Verrucomicrobiales bacterium]
MNILVAVDFSGATQNMLQEVIKLAAGLSSKIWLLHVVDPTPNFINPVDHGPGFGRP